MDDQKMQRPGIEPGSRPWEGRIIPLDHRCESEKVREPGIEPGSRPWQGRRITIIPLSHSVTKIPSGWFLIAPFWLPA